MSSWDKTFFLIILLKRFPYHLLGFKTKLLWVIKGKYRYIRGFSGGASGKEPICQCRRLKRLGFNPWVGKIPWRRVRQPSRQVHQVQLQVQVWQKQMLCVSFSPWHSEPRKGKAIFETIRAVISKCSLQNPVFYKWVCPLLCVKFPRNLWSLALRRSKGSQRPPRSKAKAVKKGPDLCAVPGQRPQPLPRDVSRDAHISKLGTTVAAYNFPWKHRRTENVPTVPVIANTYRAAKHGRDPQSHLNLTTLLFGNCSSSLFPKWRAESQGGRAMTKCGSGSQACWALGPGAWPQLPPELWSASHVLSLSKNMCRDKD